MYTTEVRVKSLPVREWLSRYCFPDLFRDACLHCPDHNMNWSCPPGLPSAEELLGGYRTVYLIGIKVIYDAEQRAVALLSPQAAERYDGAWLEDMVQDVTVVDRVCWVTAQVTVPAGGSVTVAASMAKGDSYDFYCGHTENQGVSGYDLVTALGSNLTFTGQSAALTGWEEMEIVRQNFGFDPENGVTSVTLDPGEEHYYLEVRRAAE